MKYTCIGILAIGIIFGLTFSTEAVTVYFKDGTRLEVDKVTRMGDSVCLLMDISRIDTTRTEIEDLYDEFKTVQKKGLNVVNIDFSPSDDNAEIIATGDVLNNTQHSVQNVLVTAILMDKNNHVLLRVNGHVRPDRLSPGQSGHYMFRVKKPKGFWKASIKVKAETIED